MEIQSSTHPLVNGKSAKVTFFYKTFLQPHNKLALQHSPKQLNLFLKQKKKKQNQPYNPSVIDLGAGSFHRAGGAVWRHLTLFFSGYLCSCLQGAALLFFLF